MMNLLKKTMSLLVAVILCINIMPAKAYAEGQVYSWYIKRNGTSQPHETAETKILDSYGAYYVDKSCNTSDKKKLYLTFDAGYENGNIEKILDVLKDKNVKGAFFVLNNLIIKNTDLVVRMVNDGHLICNHTNNHKNICGYTKSEIENDLSRLEKIYEQKTGLQMTKYFRFPEGKFSESALCALNELGYKSVFWSMAYADWDNNKQPDEKKAIEKLIGSTHNGAIILLHPTSATNAKILPTLIDLWRAMGYEFYSLDDLSE